MNVVLIIPTGIGCPIGGHAGDANPVAKLLGACCDKLILHPNVVNASDINEMPDNALYVDGYMLDSFMAQEHDLQEVYQNRILVAVNKPVSFETINAVNAARSTIGADIEIVELDHPLRMVSTMTAAGASGSVFGAGHLAEQLGGMDFDALAIHSEIEVEPEVAIKYFKTGGINPWGGVESMASRTISEFLTRVVPVVHAPLENQAIKENQELMKIYEQQVDPRMSAEAVSTCYLHCVFKGLNDAPRSGSGISVDDIDFLVSPFMCEGPCNEAARSKGIRQIFVRDNTPLVTCKTRTSLSRRDIIVDSYLEAAGVIMSARAGITTRSVLP